MGHSIGTAGHVDHGKSTLIRALTGVDPDRLPEEKLRQMTIDLGFARLTLPRSGPVGVVDVPGHIRYMHNLLAGIHGIELALLVVAGDEGVMPQTVEHLDILRLIGVPGVIVITKSDIADNELLAVTHAQLAETVSRTAWSEASVCEVSALTGSGMECLTYRLDRMVASLPPRANRGRPRLPIDRVFTMRGFGTVVTGTLLDGDLHLGQDLMLQPSGRRVRARGLQRHNVEETAAEPGDRVAVNLAGLPAASVQRGQVLMLLGSDLGTRLLDASLAVLETAPAPIRHGQRVTFHTGATHAPAAAMVLGGREVSPGESGWVQIRLEREISATVGDRYVVTHPSTFALLGGGQLLDVHPRRHNSRTAGIVEALSRRAAGDVLQAELEKHPKGIVGPQLAEAVGVDEVDLHSARAYQAGPLYFDLESWDRLVIRLRGEIDRYHRSHPMREGIPSQELAARLGFQPRALRYVLDELETSGTVIRQGQTVASPDHRPRVTPEKSAAFLRDLSAQPLAPPNLPKVLASSGADEELVALLVEWGQVVRVAPDLVLLKSAFSDLVSIVESELAAHGSITIAGLRDRSGTTRRVAQSVLENLDAQHVTRRVGDVHVAYRNRR